MAVAGSVERLRVRVLGPLVVEGVGERELGSRQGRTVLKVLAVARGRAVPVDRIADVLWGDEPVARPAEQVGVLVSRLRGVLGAERIERGDGGYRLVADWLDVDQLDVRTEEAAAALAAGRTAAARAAADAALALVRGPLLDGDDGEWLAGERESVARSVGRARAVALEAAAAAGDHLAASAVGEAALAADPYDEVVLRLLMRSHVNAGRPAAALAAYARVRSRLVDDLGVSPTTETEALHDLVLGVDGGPAPVVAHEVRAPVPSILGRDAELAVLDGVLAGLGGGPAAVEVIGEPGIGKSTLVSAWSGSVAVDRAVVLTGRCDELGRDLPLQPVVDALRDRLATLDQASAEAVIGPDSDVLGPLVGWDDLVPPGATTFAADPEHGRLRLYQALLAAIVRAGAGRPLVLVVEDLHDAGASTLGWLGHALRQPLPLLLVLTGRPGATRLPGATVVEVGPLDLATTAQLVGHERAADLHRRSGGHPLLLSALATARDDPGEAEGGGPAGVDTLDDAVARWRSALGPGAPSVEAAAVLGQEVDLDLLADVLQVPAVELLAQLEAAAAVGLLVERGAGYEFRHAVVRETLEASASTTRRALVHRRAARIIDARPGADPLVVAIHARSGGDRALASDRFVAAARIAASRFELESAEDHLAAALALGPSADASTEWARLHVGRRDLASAEASIVDAFAAGGSAQTWEVAAWVAYYRRDYREARSLADEGLRLATDAAGRASCFSVGGRSRHGEGDLLGGVAHLERAVAEPAPPPVHGVALVWLGQARVHQGRPADTVDLVDRALLGPGGLAHPFAPLHGRLARVHALGLLGRPADALAACDGLDQAIERAGEVGPRFVPMSANFRAWILRWTGAVDEADEWNQRGVEGTGSAAAMMEPVYAGRLDLGDGRLVVGDLDGAAAIEASLADLDTWAGGMGWAQRHRLGLLRARLALAAGDPEGAAEQAAAVAADARGRGAQRHVLQAEAVLGLAGVLDVSAIDDVVAGLGTCAGLDGWSTVATLARRHDVARWREVARSRAAALVAASGERRDAVAAWVDQVLG